MYLVSTSRLGDSTSTIGLRDFLCLMNFVSNFVFEICWGELYLGFYFMSLSPDVLLFLEDEVFMTSTFLDALATDLRSCTLSKIERDLCSVRC